MVAIFFKAIKPKKLKVGGIRLELLNALRKEGTQHRKLLRKTVETWTGARPGFESIISLRGGHATSITAPTTKGGSAKGVQKWYWLEKGTRTHYVPKSGKATMAFRPKYKAKTRPRRLSSRPGGPSGDKIIRHGRWRVRGIKARRWIPTLVRKRRRKFNRAMRKAVRRGARKAY